MISSRATGRPTHFSAFASMLMLLLVLLSLSSAALAGQAASTTAGEQPSEAQLRPLVVELLRWIGKHSEYGVDAFLTDPPEISFCECGDSVVYEGRRIVIHEPLEGMYDKKLRKITLVRPWTKKNLVNVSTLLHELVHFVQYQSRSWPCWNATEWQAYKLQALWLRQHGVKPGFNWVEIYFLSSCRRREMR